MPLSRDSLRCVVPVVRFSLFANVPHAVTTRHGGVSPEPFHSLNMGLSTGDVSVNVRRNRSILASTMGLEMESIAVARLTHGKEVSVFDLATPDRFPFRPCASDAGSGPDEAAFFSDAVISNVPNQYFLLTFADCVPLLFYDRKRHVVGAAHAGWRGTAAGIAPSVVHAMRHSFGTEPGDLVVAIGPSIGPCCYTVKSDVVDVFRRHGFNPEVTFSGDTIHLDLWATHHRQLCESGIAPENIENLHICTGCQVNDFYSHRAEHGRTGRFSLCVGL